MRKHILLIAALAPLVAVLAPVSAHAESPTGARQSADCAELHVSPPPGTRVESVTAVAHEGGTVTFEPGPLGAPGPITDVPAWCDITVTLTHKKVGDHVNVKVSLPQDERLWNGRLQATGGSAYLAGDFAGPALVAAVKGGYVATATDAGIGQSVLDVSGWALDSDGEVNGPLLENFASRSVHEMAVVAKQVAKRFYGEKVEYSYFNGCSTGGRQGYEAAQAYPKDFDGILASAPAVNWDRFAVATLWSQVVFNEAQIAPSDCELKAFNTAAVAACDTLDGVADGIISDPQDCDWNASALVGETVVCDDEVITVTQKVADAVNAIWAGPVDAAGNRLWYGPNKGADFSFLAKAGGPFFVAQTWAQWFVQKDPAFDVTKLTYERFGELFEASRDEYNSVIGSDDPNLSRFAKAGGKLISWHGQSDQLIPTQGTVDYRERVNAEFGGNERVDSFYRLFLLPGVEHCAGGPGPQAADPLGALVEWVENGQAPDTLATAALDATGGVTASRDVCRYPLETRYDGHGDPALASSYSCAR